MAGNAGGEGDLARRSDGAVLGHEQRATTGDAANGPKDSTAARVLGVGCHLDRGGHPGQFAGLGDDGVVRAE